MTAANELLTDGPEPSSSKVKLPDAKGKMREVPSEGKKSGSVPFQGFAAGTVSGLTKLAVGHPFDTVKIRMQCSPYGTFKGPGEVVMNLIRKEGILSVYKGAVRPLV